MNYADLIEMVAKKTEKPKNATKETIDATFDAILKSLANGEDLKTPIGSFKVVTHAARIGRNPQTGKTINIDAKRVPKFSASKALKDTVK